MSIVYYVPADNDDLYVATMAGRAKAKAVARNGKVSLCILDETWPFAYLQVYCDAVIDDDDEPLIDVMMAVAERMSGAAGASRAAPRGQSRRGAGRPGAGALQALRDFRHAAATLAQQRPAGPLTHWVSGSMPWDAADTAR